ncbi:TIGR04282 family arsenosugar biosynthesis glycosyltransferase [Ichthyenterobacterium sp. W332]|uniref:TIGR04282 family arsenosugar biosynthesis glycosyltransferase n=1 Tax=Microcosmobacter mediterraneus TaxID=3075607 RepID=A0ABU2YKC7_9FLAO|nr:TIGR04282 family arsenosugar biosynthesis glycosyltransferase [Ichthyenterobacterium sp. W332]MDT0558507.1 TIGR04282 family arsenosugar biosynthesis glycosyltransferase [Ichthyenterobacterium sp. W332]
MSKNLIIIFTRNPELGKVKTRLAKTIGDESALNIYRFLLEHTEKTVRKINVDKAIYYSVAIHDNDIWDANMYTKFKQEGIDLGQRMCNAFKNAFIDNYKKVLIVGSDLIDLQPKHIEDAFLALETNDIVIGPAQDGGYYLLGMKILHKKLFKNKFWGTHSVFKDTMEDLENETVFLLEELNDIDTFEDLKNNPTLKSLILQND